MKILSILLLLSFAILLLVTAAPQPHLRPKRSLRKALRSIRDSALPAFGSAAGSALGGRAGNMKFKKGK